MSHPRTNDVRGALAAMLVLWAGICEAQTPNSPTGPTDHIEIKLQPGIPSDRVFIRYVLTGETFGGWVHARPGVSSYAISTVHNGRPAAGFRAIIYAPGCAIGTIVLTLSSTSETPSYSFDCRPLPTIDIKSTLKRPDPLYGRDFQIYAKYIPRWAPEFLGLKDNFSIGIPISDVAEVAAGKAFHLAVPDLSRDPLAGTQNHPGVIQIWARAKTKDNAAESTLSGYQILLARSCDESASLPIRHEYPEIIFTPCFSGYLHDENGLAIRPDRNDPLQH